ncbi:hypothetical protein MACA111363_02720 [Macrococcoides canis]|uniref:Uncharacterized protein n=1 Tax=Macrococcoides canis TaxID=1855823 RepID=A0A1W7ABR3_9STAP|nr:hypothetical protein [Macrococcus canis]ARQ07053.1 hypothetical protein MCCS_14120 [Macrococcus canis]
MKSPTEKLKEIKSRILSKDINYIDSINEIKGKTIRDFVIISIHGIPAVLFLTEDKTVYIESVYETWDSDDDGRDYLRNKINVHKFLYMIINKEIDTRKIIELGIVNQEAYEEYFGYIREQEKIDREKYEKEQEYKRYLELKEKYE